MNCVFLLADLGDEPLPDFSSHDFLPPPSSPDTNPALDKKSSLTAQIAALEKKEKLRRQNVAKQRRNEEDKANQAEAKLASVIQSNMEELAKTELRYPICKLPAKEAYEKLIEGFDMMGYVDGDGGSCFMFFSEEDNRICWSADKDSDPNYDIDVHEIIELTRNKAKYKDNYATCRTRPGPSSIIAIIAPPEKTEDDEDLIDVSFYLDSNKIGNAGVFYKGLLYACEYAENKAVVDAALAEQSEETFLSEYHLVCGECAQTLTCPLTVKMIKCEDCGSVYKKKRLPVLEGMFLCFQFVYILIPTFFFDQINDLFIYIRVYNIYYNFFQVRKSQSWMQIL